MAAVLVTEFMDGSALAFLKNRVQVDYAPNICENHQEIMRRIADVHALIVRNRTQVTADIFACANHLKAVGRLGVGLDNIDLGGRGTCECRGRICNWCERSCCR